MWPSPQPPPPTPPPPPPYNLVEISDPTTSTSSKLQQRRLILTDTHLLIQKCISTADTDSTKPVHGSVSDEDEVEDYVQQHKRIVELDRGEDGQLGISVRGGSEYGLPLIISRVSGGGGGSGGKVVVGDCILAINNIPIRHLTHDSSLQILNSSGPHLTLLLKYLPTTRPYLTPSSTDDYYETEKQIPLTFAILTRYLKSTDQLRVNSFQLWDCTGNCTSGVVYCNSSWSLSYWMKLLNETIGGLNSGKLKSWSTPTNTIHYYNWISTGIPNTNEIDNFSPRLKWESHILGITSQSLYYLNYLPGLMKEWNDCESVPIYSTLLRVLAPSEILDERVHVFSLQVVGENRTFPPTFQRPNSHYCSTETRQELLRIEAAWTRGVLEAVRREKTLLIPVWWSGKPCSLELNFPTSTFRLLRPISANSSASVIWTRSFSTLISSSDDSRTRCTLKFNNQEQETFECRDLHKLLFALHAWLLARVIK